MLSTQRITISLIPDEIYVKQEFLRDTYAAVIWTVGSTTPVVLVIIALLRGFKNPERRRFSGVVDALPAVALANVAAHDSSWGTNCVSQRVGLKNWNWRKSRNND